jgi:hypothetical protein
MKRIDLGVSRGPSKEEREVIKRGYESRDRVKESQFDRKGGEVKVDNEYYKGEAEEAARSKVAREVSETHELSKEQSAKLKSGTQPIPGAQLDPSSFQGRMAKHSAAFIEASVKKDRPKMEAARTAFHATKAETTRGGIPWKHGVETPCGTAGCGRTEHEGPHTNEMSVSRANPAGES